jgi:hypothetical protein
MEALQRLHNRGSISTGYNIDNSLVLESDNSERLHKTPSGAGNRRTFTISFWTKRTEINGVKQYIFEAGNSDSNTDRFTLRFGTGDTFDIQSQSTWLITNRVFRDTSAYYHFVIKVDTTDSTAANRIKLYVNGVEETSFSTDNRSSINQNNDFPVNNTEIHNIGSSPIEGGLYYNGYIAEWVQIDGTASAPTEFGEFDDDTGIWKPKSVSASGTNGFYLDFKDSSNMGNDAGGGLDFTLVNITSADQATDTPTNNFCTLNILNALSNGGGNNEYTEGATKAKALETAEMASGTMAVAQGKWYYECKALTNSDIMPGWGVPNKWGHHSNNPGYDEYSFAAHWVGRAYYYGNSYIDFSPSVSWGTNDIISVALDADNGFCYWAKNGTWMNGGSPTSGSTGTGGFNYIGGSTGANMEIVDGDFLIPAFRTNYAPNASILLNFGGFTTISISSAESDADGYGTFEYAPPSGYYALCTKNLEEYG